MTVIGKSSDKKHEQIKWTPACWLYHPCSLSSHVLPTLFKERAATQRPAASWGAQTGPRVSSSIMTLHKLSALYCPTRGTSSLVAEVPWRKLKFRSLRTENTADYFLEMSISILTCDYNKSKSSLYAFGGPFEGLKPCSLSEHTTICLFKCLIKTTILWF